MVQRWPNGSTTVPLRSDHARVQVSLPYRSPQLRIIELCALRRHIFSMGGNEPLVAERIFDRGIAVAIVLVGWFADRLRACRQGTLVERIHVRNIEVKHRLLGLVWPVRVAQLDQRGSVFNGS